MKNTILISAATLMAVSLLGGCGKTNAEVYSEPADNIEESSTSQDDSIIEGDNADDETADVSSETALADEIATIEAKSQEFENMDWNIPQQEANQTTYEWFKLWDDELNSLWNRINESENNKYKDDLISGQKDWITRKEANVKEAGEQALGGTLQPQLENSTAMEMTRARVYFLAGCLAEVEGYAFDVPENLQTELDQADPDVGFVFSSFEGKYVIGNDNNSAITIEPTEKCEYGVNGSDWMVWVTHGVILSDLDMDTFTRYSITFVKKEGNTATYYKLRRNLEGGIELASGTSPDNLDDITYAE